MVRIDRRKHKGKVYLYLEERAWINGKSKRLWQRYLGPEKKFQELSKLSLNLEIETETIEFGLIAALLLLVKKLGLVELINSCTCKRNQGLSVGEHMVIAAINRCVEPVSKRHLKEWLNSTVLNKIYPNLGSALDSRSYWTHYRYLDEEIVDSIGNTINQALDRCFHVDFSTLLYDPTNFFTFINPKKENQTIPRHGNSKEGRDTLNIINFSLFCALDGGIPLLHLLYPGNIHDSTSFPKALHRLKERLIRIHVPIDSITLTFDKGNLSEEAFNMINTQQLHYITSLRPSTRKALLFLSPETFQRHLLPNGKQVGVLKINATSYQAFLEELKATGKDFEKKSFETHGQNRRIIAVYNPNQAKWQKENFDTKLKKKVTEITEFFKTRLNKKVWKNQNRVFNKCQSVLGAKKFKKVVSVEIHGTEGNLSLSVTVNQERYDEQLLHFGKSFLMTNREDLAAWEVVWAYRQQYIVENAFKMLKSPYWLSIRPAWVRTDQSIEGHSFVCFLGLLLLNLLVRDLFLQNFSLSLPTVIKRLKAIKITKITLPGKKTPIYRLNKMDEEEKALFEALQLRQFL